MKKFNAIIRVMDDILTKEHPELPIYPMDRHDLLGQVERAVQDDLAVFLLLWPRLGLVLITRPKSDLENFPEFSDGRVVYRLDDGDVVNSLLGGAREDEHQSGLAKVKRLKR
jgi:hypothetical protein